MGSRCWSTCGWHEATRSSPVIVVTGQALTDADMQRLNRGVAAILSKGIFTADETLRRIQAALARQSGAAARPSALCCRRHRFIQAHFAEPLTRDDIAGHIAISGNYLTECFRQVLGITPMTYLTRYRIQRAQHLLNSTISTSQKSRPRQVLRSCRISLTRLRQDGGLANATAAGSGRGEASPARLTPPLSYLQRAPAAPNFPLSDKNNPVSDKPARRAGSYTVGAV